MQSRSSHPGSKVRTMLIRQLKLISLFTLFVLSAYIPIESLSGEIWDTYSDTWTATDALGRVLPGHEEAGDPRPGKYAVVFYYIWHGQHGTELYDNDKILRENPNNPQWGPVHAYHFSAEPLYGYYFSDDEYVIRKNAQMLADAGVDAIFFDVTNAVAYTDIYLKLCRIYTDIRSRGGRTPQIAFLTNTESGKTAQSVYDNLYAKGLYKDLWFHWNGKPIVLAKEEELSEEVKNFFTVRRSWAWEPGQDKWPWLEHLPQQGGWHESPDKLEQMVVETAQHPIMHNNGMGLGKSFHNGVQPPPGKYESEKGYYFAEQWKRALEADPQLIFITQWNEWIAMRFLADKPMKYAGQDLKAGDSYFVDVYSIEFNRDIEPMKEGYGDNYYYQMVDGIRRFKGVRKAPEASKPKTIDLKDFSSWNDVQPEYRDDIGDTFHRDHPGYGGKQYLNKTGRNDFKILKTTCNGEYHYFYAETVEPITPKDGINWMMLFIQLKDSKEPAWEGYQFLVQPKTSESASPISLKKCTGGWNWETIANVDYFVEGNRLALRIPNKAFGENSLDSFRFKWADNMQEFGTQDWILNGDAAPNGRFQYNYVR